MRRGTISVARSHVQKRTISLCILALNLALFGGCAGLTTPALTGVSGSSLFSTQYPPVAVAANAPLTLKGYGNLWVSLYNQESLTTQPTGSFAYAVYSGGDSGPVTRHAHALIVRPQSGVWSFQLESFKGPDTFSLSKSDIGGITWTAQIMRVASRGDWFSAMWTENKRSVPELWIAKRFSATPDRQVRMVAEYREPWPECLDPMIPDLSLTPADCLKGFLGRADAAFTLDAPVPAVQETPAPSMLHVPPVQPNTRKLAGEVQNALWNSRP